MRRVAGWIGFSRRNGKIREDGGRVYDGMGRVPWRERRDKTSAEDGLEEKTDH